MKPSILDLKAWQVKRCAFLMGLPSSGSKADVARSIQHQLRQPPISLQRNRVISVDMGIRNLAFCCVDVNGSHGSRSVATRLNVKAWKKVDLLHERLVQLDDRDTKAMEDPSVQTASKPTGKVPPDTFTPSSLAKIAYGISDHLLSYEPDTILIERQRFRSGGAAAIQEWTVRVNMLESMLWSCMHTLRQRRSPPEKMFSMHEVLPARVASFWTAGPRTRLRPTPGLLDTSAKEDASDSVVKTGRKRVDKQEKIDVVRAWLKGSEGVTLDIAGDANSTAALFDSTARSSKAATGKLDDLADCLLQAAAWVRWQENQQTVKQLLEDLRPP